MVSTHPPNIFHGKILGRVLDKYLDLHKRQDAIIPDLMICDYIGDINASRARNMGSIYDIKTLRVDKNQKIYTKHSSQDSHRATYTKTKDVRRDYMRRCEKLDIKCTNDDRTHHFLEALANDFHSGGVHPLVFGTYGEINKETRNLIRLCAMMAASKEENLDVSPLDNAMRKGTAYNVLLTQFMRATRVMAMQTVAQIKLRRATFIQSSNVEAAAAARTEDFKHYLDHGNH